MHMEQMTVKKLWAELNELMAKGEGDKKIVIATDEEGNSYRGMYYSCMDDPINVKESIEYSNGLYDSQEKNPDNLVIIG